jgi:hypothetical protein
LTGTANLRPRRPHRDWCECGQLARGGQTDAREELAETPGSPGVGPGLTGPSGLIDQLRAGRSPIGQRAGVAGCDRAGHGLVRDPGELSGITQRPGQVELMPLTEIPQGCSSNFPTW